MKATIGKTIANLHFECTDPHLHSFADLLGKKLVLYFYPKDNTPGCTIEGQDFRDLYTQFQNKNTQIIGVSRDTLLSHNKFCNKLALPFPLISDKDETLCNYFGVLIEKNMFMRMFIGIDRSTFLINEKGVLIQEWRKVKVKNHAQIVLEAVQE